MLDGSSPNTDAPRLPRHLQRAEGWLWPTTVGLSAFLLFAVQPLVARLVTPLLGGSSSVWNVALMFFQTVLLVGYGYAHAVRRLPHRVQLALHVGLLLVAITLLPWVGINLDALDRPGLPEPARVLLILAALVGVPYLMLTTHGPLLQRWFTQARGPGSDPYRLAAVSNAASLAALLAYPLLIEPLLGLRVQIGLWCSGFVLLAGCVTLLGLIAARSAPAPEAATAAARASSAPIPWPRVAAWVGFSALPSALVVGLTSTISNDVGAFPLMWTLPLAIYLLTLQQAFSGDATIERIRRERSATLVLSTLLLAIVSLLLTSNIFLILAASLVTLYYLGRAFHGELVARRPEPQQLTAFYLWMAVGGALGGGAAALLAPILFRTPLETPLMLCIATVVLAWPGCRRLLARRPLPRAAIMLLTAAALAIVLAAGAGQGDSAKTLQQALVLSLTLLPLIARRRAYLLAVTPILALALAGAGALGNLTVLSGTPVLTVRSFYGVNRVLTFSGNFTVLVHGTTIHGIQHNVGLPGRPEVISYYAADGPLGTVFRSTRMARAQRIGMVGLGAGVTACYATPGQRWEFYELDAAVVRIARDARLFTYLRDCTPDAAIIVGDARVTLRGAPDGAYDLLIIDAYAGDTVPMHLLTSEAFALYRQKLSPDGIMAIHISHRVINLAPLIAPLADAYGLVGRRAIFKATEEQRNRGVSNSDWIVLSSDQATINAVAAGRDWQDLADLPRADLLTDDTVSIVPVLANLKVFSQIRPAQQP